VPALLPDPLSVKSCARLNLNQIAKHFRNLTLRNFVDLLQDAVFDLIAVVSFETTSDRDHRINPKTSHYTTPSSSVVKLDMVGLNRHQSRAL
jgi:hypothetical protein